MCPERRSREVFSSPLFHSLCHSATTHSRAECTRDGEGVTGPRETATDNRDTSPLEDRKQEVLWKGEEYQGTAGVCLMKHELQKHLREGINWCRV